MSREDALVRNEICDGLETGQQRGPHLYLILNTCKINRQVRIFTVYKAIKSNSRYVLDFDQTYLRIFEDESSLPLTTRS